jgi:hypothetical protein
LNAYVCCSINSGVTHQSDGCDFGEAQQVIDDARELDAGDVAAHGDGLV